MAIYRQEDGAALRSQSVMSLRQRGEDSSFDLAHKCQFHPDLHKLHDEFSLMPCIAGAWLTHTCVNCIALKHSYLEGKVTPSHNGWRMEAGHVLALPQAIILLLCAGYAVGHEGRKGVRYAGQRNLMGKIEIVKNSPSPSPPPPSKTVIKKVVEESPSPSPPPPSKVVIKKSSPSPSPPPPSKVGCRPPQLRAGFVN